MAHNIDHILAKAGLIQSILAAGLVLVLPNFALAQSVGTDTLTQLNTLKVIEFDEDDNSQLADTTPNLAASNRLSRGPNQPVSHGNGQRINQRVQPIGPNQLVNPAGELRSVLNAPVAPIQANRQPADRNPFEALGIRAGSFLLFPVLQGSFGFTNNADQTTGGEASVFSQTDARVSLQSDWTQHELRGEAGISALKYLTSSTDSSVSANANVDLRIDIETGLVARFGIGYELSSESATGDNINIAPGQVVDGRPFIHSLKASAALERTGLRLFGSLRGTVERSLYSDIDLQGGSALSQDDRDFTEFQVTARAGYEISPAVQPFGEARIGYRLHDLEQDKHGIARDAVLLGLRGGMVVNLGEKLFGELAIGYSAELYDDTSLKSLDGVTIDGQLNWSPERLTTITAETSTQFNTSTVPNESGSVTYAASLGVVRDVRPDFSLNAKATAAIRSYDNAGRDITLQSEVGMEWRLSRYAALIGKLAYETVDSSDPLSTYDAASVRMGMRIQR